MLPIPKHLSQLLKPIGNSNNEFSVMGKIACGRGSEKFTIGIVGDDSNYETDRVIL